jgi:membrane associated rhomboid family serine protease
MEQSHNQSVFNNISTLIIIIIGGISFVSMAGILFPFINIVLKNSLALYPEKITLSDSYRLITYAFLHHDYAHLGMNMVWLLIFASPIHRFFGTRSFLIIFIMGIITGGLIFLTDDTRIIAMGASAGVSACAGASLRFMLKPAMDFYGRPQIYRLTDGRFLMPSVLFFAVDIIHAFFMTHAGQNIAWQSHIIGFITGAFLLEINFINKNAMKRHKLTPHENTYLGD